MLGSEHRSLLAEVPELYQPAVDAMMQHIASLEAERDEARAALDVTVRESAKALTFSAEKLASMRKSLLAMERERDKARAEVERLREERNDFECRAAQAEADVLRLSSATTGMGTTSELHKAAERVERAFPGEAAGIIATAYLCAEQRIPALEAEVERLRGEREQVEVAIGKRALAGELPSLVRRVEEEWRAIKELTQKEGAAVTINYPNPDFGGPNYCITWTPALCEESVDYYGDTYMECLEQALAALEPREGQNTETEPKD